MSEEIRNFLGQASKYLFAAVVLALVILLFLAFFRISIGFWLWSTVETFVIVRLGLGYDEAQLATVIGVVLITLLMPVIASLAWYFLLGKKQLEAAGIVIGGQVIIFLLVSTIGSGVCFDRQTGKSQCYYADIPGRGRVFSRTPGFDPKIGVEFKEYTREIASSSQPIEFVNSDDTDDAAIVFNSPILITFKDDNLQNQFEMRIREFRIENSKESGITSSVEISVCNTGDTTFRGLTNDSYRSGYFKLWFTDFDNRGTISWDLNSSILKAKECQTLVPSVGGQNQKVAVALKQRRGTLYVQMNNGNILQFDLSNL